MACFSETRCRSQGILIEAIHQLIYSQDRSAASATYGMIVFVHNRWIGAIKRRICLHDPVMTIDLTISQKIIRVIVNYLPNSLNYDLSYFESNFSDIDGFAMDTNNKRHAVIMVRDCNLHLN